MRELTLHRFCYAPFGVYGRFDLEGEWLFTVEPAWLDNAPFVSCIPDGEYTCRARQFYRGGYPAIEIADVPGRSAILFHKANWPHELGGCVAPNLALVPGGDHCPLRGASSATAFERLMQWLNELDPPVPAGGTDPRDFTLHIVNATGARLP